MPRPDERAPAAGRPRRTPMRQYGYRTLSVYVKEDLYQAMRTYCFRKELKHSDLIRTLLEAELKRKGLWKK